MKTIESVLKVEVNKLEKVIEQAKERLRTAPKGFLRISRKGSKTEYYYKSAEISNKNGRYIKKKERELARRLAQRDYDARIIEISEERIKAIHIFLKKYKETDLGEIYGCTNQYRRALISAVKVSDEEYVKQWLAMEYVGKSFAEEYQEIITERGERVRSKSEKIIADKLYSLGIPYRYEYPLILERNIKIYPDFTILKMPAREEIYLEHFGMMDDQNYVETVMGKLNTYERNGIYIGVNLFITYETSRNPLSTRTLDGLLRSLLCRE